jgi:hypothetical protein
MEQDHSRQDKSGRSQNHGSFKYNNRARRNSSETNSGCLAGGKWSSLQKRGVPPMKPYRGILFVTNTMITKLASRGSGAISEVLLHNNGDEIEVIWSNGGTSNLRCKDLLSKADLEHLPVPTTAFNVEPDGNAIGLLFESSVPLKGLQYQEPHSLVFPVGWLTTDGLRDHG